VVGEMPFFPSCWFVVFEVGGVVVSFFFFPDFVLAAVVGDVEEKGGGGGGREGLVDLIVVVRCGRQEACRAAVMEALLEEAIRGGGRW